MVNWWMAALGALIILALFGLGAAAGFLRWWRRRRALAQIALLVLLPMIVVVAGVGAGLLLDMDIYNLAGLLFGLGVTALLCLISTSYLVEQIRVAFSAPDEPPNED
ncbi:MAG TPA: hypothetical protein VD886_17380 [Herpetosiphonaceae bacterium]|nr:hypothetical protein [Herpetosiphonaceae bacterium]